MATMCRLTEAQHLADARAPPPQHLADAYVAPQQPGELGCGSHTPSSCFGLRSSSGLESPGRRMPGLQFLEPPSDHRVSSPAPSLPPPSGKMVSDTKNSRILRPNPEIHLRQSKKFAEAALTHYNKRTKMKLELVDVKPYISVPEPHSCYTHINFTARSIKEGSKEQLFFAELLNAGRCRDDIIARYGKKGSQHSVNGKRQPLRGLHVTCCEPLGPDATVGQRFLKPDGTSRAKKHDDVTYCFACSEATSHPKGEKYIAGHCNVPNIYSCVR